RRRKRATYERQRKMTQVRAARGRELHAADRERGERKLHQRSILSRDRVRHRRRTRISVSGPADRKETRVVCVPFGEQHVEGPFGSAQDREARRAVAKHRGTGEVLE